MALNMRTSEADSRLYNPARDVAHNFQDVVQSMAERLEDGVWSELDSLLKKEGISLDELGEACGRYAEYVAMAANKDTATKSVEEALEHSGFLNTDPVAQIAVMAMLGQIYTGIQHVGIREVTLGGDGPAADTKDLLKAADRIRQYMSKPRWLRNLRRRWRRFIAVLHFLRA